MRVNRTLAPGRAIRLAIVTLGLVVTHALVPVNADQGTGASVLEQSAALTTRCDVSPAETMRPGGGLGPCEAALAACMNGGGSSDACWNAYWRCISK
jgi:hypothetical protein